ncbi:MAG: glycosyltransferase [Spartobacteria bacterium]|nr:glycosyltransferase [Spartobacteria bacterium]
MRILYVMTAPLPKIEGTDAVFQEAALLKAHFGGEIVTAYPFQRPCAWIPPQLFGWHLVRSAERIRREYDLIHVYSARYFNYPFLKNLGLPVVYTVSASLNRPAGAPASWLKCLISADRRMIETVKTSWGIPAACILPGIESAEYTETTVPAAPPFVITYASAPWTIRQFYTKGFVMLFQVLQKMPDVHLQLIWRGHYEKELEELLDQFDVRSQVRVVSGRVDVRACLSRGHAAVVLAKDKKLVKSYPHSLIESLQVGRPIVVNREIAMAEFVADNKCGVVVNEWSVSALVDAITELRDNYNELSLFDMNKYFTVESFLLNHKRVYQQFERGKKFQ